MAGFERIGRCLHVTTQQGKVPNQVQHLMPGRLVLEIEIHVVQDAFRTHLHFRFAQHLRQTFHFRLVHHPVHEHNGIVQIPAFNQIVGKQEFYFPQEYEGTATGHFLGVVFPERVNTGELGYNHGRIVVDFDRKFPFVGRHHLNFHIFLLVTERHRLTQTVIPALGLLLANPGLQNRIGNQAGASVQNRHFHRICLNQGIVYLQTGQCRQDMLHCGHSRPVFFQGRSPGRVHYVFGQSPDFRLLRQVCPFENEPRADRSRLDGDGSHLAGMQADARHAHGRFQGSLFDYF